MSTKNEEKAHAMLNRWVAIKKELNSRSKEKRPKYTSECHNLQDCERWRNQIIKEITKKVADIQNASLGEFRIREMNDDINKLFREKSEWESRIKELGGVDYKKLTPKTFDAEGYEVPNSGGYKYWGAAKDLPGVRELFAVQAPNAPRKNIIEMYKGINEEYYGDYDDDEEMLQMEKQREEELMKEYLNELKEINKTQPLKKKKGNDGEAYHIEHIRDITITKEELEGFKLLHSGVNYMFDKYNKLSTYNGSSKQITKEELEKELLEKKKKELLNLLNA
jgi:pre-mRNA-splicing factor ISY1